MVDLSYREFLDQEVRAQARRRHPLRILVLFLVVFLVLQQAWGLCRDTPVERLFIDQITARPAAWAIDLIRPGHGVEARGHSLVSSRGRLNILNGCEGLEALFLLAAAFVAYPFTLRARLLGLGLGIVLIFALNQARIVALWFAFLNDRALFGMLHGTVLPLALVAACLAYFLAFIARHDVRSA